MRDHRRAKYRNPTERQTKLAKDLESGLSIQKAMLKNGYSANVAKMGRVAVPKVVWALLKNSKDLLDLGDIDVHTQEKLIRGRLAQNVITGKDGGATSAKILGQDRRLNMFTPDNVTGIVVIGGGLEKVDIDAE